MDAAEHCRYRLGQPCVNVLNHIEDAWMGTADQHGQRISGIQDKTNLIAEVIRDKTVFCLSDKPFGNGLKPMGSGKSGS